MKKYAEGQTVRIQGMNRNKKVVVYDFEYAGLAPSNRPLFERNGKRYFWVNDVIQAANGLQRSPAILLRQIKDVTGELVIEDRMTLDCFDSNISAIFHKTAFPVTLTRAHASVKWTLNGERLPNKESSGTHASVENLRWLIERIGQPYKIEQKNVRGEDIFVLFHFQHEGVPYSYIAGGFCVNYTGTGPQGLVEIAWLAGFGEATEPNKKRPGRPELYDGPGLWDSRFRNLLNKVARTSREFTGVLWERKRPLVNGRRIIQVFDGQGVL